MSEEIFDVVNQEDAIVGQARAAPTCRNCFIEPFMFWSSMRTVDSFYKLMTKDCFPGTRFLGIRASGQGESDACAIREVGEELGWIPDRPLEKLFKLPASLETGWDQSGFTASLTMALLYCTRKKSSPVSGLRPMR